MVVDKEESFQISSDMVVFMLKSAGFFGFKRFENACKRLKHGRIREKFVRSVLTMQMTALPRALQIWQWNRNCWLHVICRALLSISGLCRQ
jgi:hypothetical protein